MEVLSLLSFGGALAVRLMYKRWQAWVVWVGVSLMCCAVVSFSYVIGASILGFIAPELWHALRTWLRRPQNVIILFVCGIAIYAIYIDQRVLGMLLAIVILLLALRQILGFKSKKGPLI